MIGINAVFGAVLRGRRIAMRLSQEELAGLAGLHRTFISLIERGQRNPSLDVIRKLALALDTTATSLVSEVEQQLADAARTN